VSVRPSTRGVGTVDFGAPEEFGAHVFRIEVPANRTEAVRLVEDFGYKGGGENGLPYDELRAVVGRQTWTVLADAARRDFNERLKANKQSTGRWKTGRTLLEKLLGKELCVLAWAAEGSTPEEMPVICTRWAALRPEERWWLFSMTVAEAGLPEDGDRGWRKALRFALSDGARTTTDDRRKRARPREEDRELPLFRGLK
jgi:hypothetical protein